MDYTDYLEDAVAQVDAWNLAEADFAQAVNAQARIMASVDLEPTVDTAQPSPYSQLAF
jgi:hypothetical protein